MTLAAQMPTVRWQHLLAERVAERVALKLHHRSVPELALPTEFQVGSNQAAQECRN